jgi:hypothetical protein
MSPTRARQEVPILKLVEWNGKATSVLSKLFRLFTQGTESFASTNIIDPRVDNPIKGTYIAEPTGIEYHLPALGLGDWTEQVANDYGYGDQNSPFRNITQSVKNVFQQRFGLAGLGGVAKVPGIFSTTLKTMLTEVGSLAKAGSSIIYGTVAPTEVQFFTGTGLQSYTFTLDLLNTVSTEEVAANREFIKVLMHQNMHEKTNFIVSRPPCLYSAELVGRKWWPAVSLAPSVQNLGSFLNIDGVPTPEAYRITIVMNELLPQFRRVERLYQDNNQQKLSAFIAPDQICSEVQTGLDNASEGFRNIGIRI